MNLIDEVGVIVFKDFFGNNVRVGDKALFAGKCAYAIFTDERIIKHLSVTKVKKDKHGKISVYFEPSKFLLEEHLVCSPDDLVKGEHIKDIKKNPRFKEWLKYIHTKYKITQ